MLVGFLLRLTFYLLPREITDMGRLTTAIRSDFVVVRTS